MSERAREKIINLICFAFDHHYPPNVSVENYTTWRSHREFCSTIQYYRFLCSCCYLLFWKKRRRQHNDNEVENYLKMISFLVYTLASSMTMRLLRCCFLFPSYKMLWLWAGVLAMSLSDAVEMLFSVWIYERLVWW